MLIQGHRGSPDNYPENTILSFDMAIQEGADGIEMDVRVSSDGEYVIMHDSTVDRTTNGTGRIDELTLTQIKSLDAGSWKGSQFVGVEVPTLDEILTKYKGVDTILILHLVGVAGNTLRLVDKVKDMGMLEQCHFFGSSGTLNNVKNYEPNAYVYNSGRANISDYEDTLQNAIDNNFQAVSIDSLESQTNLQIMTNDIKVSGLKVHLSYLSSNYSETIPILKNIGIDYVLGDNVLEMVNALNIEGDPPPQPNREEITKMYFIGGKGRQCFIKTNSGLKKVELYS